MADFDTAIDRIKAILQANTDPVFVHVYQGEPLMVGPDGPQAAFWYVGDTPPPEGRQTLGHRMTAEQFTVRVYWPVRPELTSQADLEKEIVACKKALQAAFWGDVFLNGAGSTKVVDGMDIGDATSGYVRYGEFDQVGRARALSFDLWLYDLESEAEGD